MVRAEAVACTISLLSFICALAATTIFSVNSKVIFVLTSTSMDLSAGEADISVGEVLSPGSSGVQEAAIKTRKKNKKIRMLRCIYFEIIKIPILKP